MRNLKLAGIVAGIAVVVATCAVSVASAVRFSADIDSGETVDSTVYSTGKTVSVSGTINGDVFCAGQNVTIDGTVHGDVICAGQDVTVSGTVDGSVRVAGQRVSISAAVERNVSVVADTFSLDASAKVGGDVSAAGNLLNLKGAIGRDATIAGSQGIINGAVGRAVSFDGKLLELKSGARIQGGITYTSASDLKKNAGAQVTGRVDHTKPTEHKRRLAPGFTWYLLVLSALLLMGLVIALAAPRQLHSAATVLVQKWSKALITGILAGFAPLVAVVLAFTIVGIPLAITLLAAWAILAALSGPVAGYALGRSMLKSQKNVPLRMMVGGAVLITLYFVPFLGLIVLLGAYWLGSGAVLLAFMRRIGKPSYTAL